MDHHSSANPNEYDGPIPPADPVPLFPGQRLRFASEQPAEPAPDPRSSPAYIAAISAALDMLATRLHLLIAMVAACLLWSWVIYDPIVLRIYAALGFSLTVLMPIIVTHWRRG